MAVKSILGLVLCLLEPQVAECMEPVCALEDIVTASEKVPAHKRVKPVLEGLSACAALGDLASAAKKAAPLDRTARAKALAALAPPECKAASPTAAASSIAAKCSMAIVETDSGALRHLDAGTYGFLVAAWRALGGKDASPAAVRLILTVVMAGALEGEKK